jgi:hypothetical protein
MLSSPKLIFPKGVSRVVTVEPPGDTFVFPAFARSTGAFPVRVLVSNPEGTVPFRAALLTVRSTAYNVAALALTVGGAIFLIGWYVRLLSRRQRSPGRRP